MNELPIAIPGYRIVRLLGRGGMATVYLALQECLEREVALKIMAPILNLDPAFTARFIREARIVAQMKHQSIVQVYDVGEYQKHHYLSMEYLPGIDLKQRILQGQYGVELAVRICEAIASALDVAHRKGFVHRDIKPENVLFRDDGTPVLTDFGIARAIDSGGTMTRAGMLVGTPAYMSPEQVKGQELDGRSDLYALGIVFYEMLTGAVPFRADSTISAAMKHLSEPIPRLPASYARYQTFIEKLTAKERDARFASGAEVVAELRQLGQPREPEGATQIRVLSDDERKSLEAKVAARQLRGDSMHWLESNGELSRVTYAGQLAQLNQSVALPVNFTFGGYSDGARTGAIVPVALPAVVQKTLPIAAPSLPAVFSATIAPPAPVRTTWIGASMLGALGAVIVLGGGFLLYRSGEVRSHTNVREIPGVQPIATEAPAIDKALETAAVEPAVIAEASPASETATSAQIDPAAEPSATESGRDRRLASQRSAATRRRLAQQREAQRLEAAAREAAELERQVRVQTLLARAEDNLRAGRIAEPEEDNALSGYRQALTLEPQQPEALAGLNRVAALLIDRAEKAVADRKFSAANRALDRADAIQPGNVRSARVRNEITLLEAQEPPDFEYLNFWERQQRKKALRYIDEADELLERAPGNLSTAKRAARLYDDAADASSSTPQLAGLKARIVSAYVAAAQASMSDGNVEEVMNVIDHARDRQWLSTELQEIEAAIRASARLQEQ